jgi:hypothetical protein
LGIEVGGFTVAAARCPAGEPPSVGQRCGQISRTTFGKIQKE